MTDKANGVLSLDAVCQRFAESEKALDQAHLNLARLASAEKLATAASDQLAETARLVAEYARAAGELVGELAQTQRQAQEVLKAGIQLFDSSEFHKIRDGIAALCRGQEELERRIGDSKAAEARAKSAEEIVIRVKAILSRRTLKKLGLDG